MNGIIILLPDATAYDKSGHVRLVSYIGPQKISVFRVTGFKHIFFSGKNLFMHFDRHFQNA